MEKRFKVLRIIGNIWKVLAWITLIVGTLSAIGILVTSIFGGGLLRQLAQQQGHQVPWAPSLFTAAGGVAAFIVSLVATVIYFFMLYAVGQLIDLLLAIEENTRLAARSMQPSPAPQQYPAARPAPRAPAPSSPIPEPPLPPEPQP